jgi:hypothetical protein
MQLLGEARKVRAVPQAGGRERADPPKRPARQPG